MRGIRFQLWMLVSAQLMVAGLAQADPAPVKASWIPGLGEAWLDFDSPLWSNAGTLKDFKVPGLDQRAAAPGQATEVRLANDGKRLFMKITAFDDDPGKLKVGEFDEFANEFPQGDHVEVWWLSGWWNQVVLAFDPAGNKYEARDFDRRCYSALCRSKARRTAKSWEIVAALPLRSLNLRGEAPETPTMTFVRHLDHGRGRAERSFSSGMVPHFSGSGGGWSGNGKILIEKEPRMEEAK